MDQIAIEPAEDRRELFEATARSIKLPFVMIEKDFWVCWTLKHLFEDATIGPSLIFKGGTSLSKVFRAIERFSEDIDLSIQRDFLGFTSENDPQAKDISRTEKDKRVKNLRQSAKDHVRDTLLPHLLVSFSKALGEASTIWRLEIDEYDADVIHFFYPTSRMEGDAPSYVASAIKLEFGAGSDPYPTGIHLVTPYAAEAFAGAFKQTTCQVTALEATRTFWEKATLLHAEYHRPPDQATPTRISRHYSDLARLAKHPDGIAAAMDIALLERVAAHKSIYFRSGWANYATAHAGSLRLVPQSSRKAHLIDDYDQMRVMFFAPPPPFNEVLDILQQLEDTINSRPTI